ncbi:MAG: hypothetical protein D6712_01450 [Chloroflexi bacterium]|nr:MAG: hypothetical protein D6712_01450 [Chloroflexota bacterium]
MFNRKFFSIVLLLVIVALGAMIVSSAAAREAAHGDDEEGEAEEIEIILTEYAFTVEGGEENAPIVLHAGDTYKLEFVNEGEMMHEVLFGAGVIIEDDFAVGYEENIFEDVEAVIEGEMNGAEFEVEVSGIEEIELNPGQKLEIMLTIPEELIGEWEIGCFVKGHYELGMVAPLIIEAEPEEESGS